MKPYKSPEYFIKVNFQVLVDMEQVASPVNLQTSTGKIFFIKNYLLMKNLTHFRKTVETGVDPRLDYRVTSILL